MLSKTLVPVNELLFASNVLDAAVIVIFCEPSNAVPLIFREVARVVAVPAFPLTEPVMVLTTVRAPKVAEVE